MLYEVITTKRIFRIISLIVLKGEPLTGHGLGLDIHEPPSIFWNNGHKLQDNTVITIEPGVYLINKFGYRYENTILVQKNKTIELTNQ